MAAPLNEFERRVLGCLMEKQMTVPDAYPMTENALIAACNQKNNRDPVMELDGEAVWEALESLREKGLVTVVLPGPEGRTKRFKHEVEAVYKWPKRERAIMTELLLRGPQTAGELRGRCNRFMPFENVEAVTIVLENLRQASPPWVKTMPREPGQAATRYMHLLYPEEEMPAVGAAATSTAPRAAGEPAGAGASLRSEIEALRAEVAALMARVERLEKELSAG
jgi:uncharacterized protein YceH (UPF0502 family)